ncbi:hypothetical protein SBADM41S_11372 [Streptomyces badius]
MDQGLLERSVQWRTGIAARQLGELDKARTTLSSVVGLYHEAQNDAGAALALCSLGITLHHQGNLRGGGPAGGGAGAPVVRGQAEDRAWTLHALAAVERDRGDLPRALALLAGALRLHREGESLHGEAWTRFQLGQVRLRTGEVAAAEEALSTALELYGRTRDGRGEAWAITQLAWARLLNGDPAAALEQLREALVGTGTRRTRAVGRWNLYFLGQALEEDGTPMRRCASWSGPARVLPDAGRVRAGERPRHQLGRVTRDQRSRADGQPPAIRGSPVSC